MSKKEQTDGYVTVRLPQELVNEVDKCIDRRKGYTSRADVVKAAIRDFFEKVEAQQAKLPRFEHFNAGDNGVKITDRRLHVFADVYFKPQGIFCEYDKSSSCEHIDFALTVPVIQEIIRRRRKEGWKLPDV